MTTIPIITDDPRPIAAIRLGPAESYTVGFEGVIEIRAYPEAGQMSTVPYYAVILTSGHIIARVPGQMAIVVYQEVQ